MVDILEYVSDYFCFLLSFVVVYVFVKKYKEIFFYILCIVGMRFFLERWGVGFEKYRKVGGLWVKRLILCFVVFWFEGGMWVYYRVDGWY